MSSRTTDKVYPNLATIKALYGAYNRLYMNWKVDFQAEIHKIACHILEQIFFECDWSIPLGGSISAGQVH